ncbi:MAG: hypothetical protein R2705_20050 [Ilumatobacteraceae bacterium]
MRGVPSRERRRIDTVLLNGERFAVMAGVGFDALMIRDANSATKRRFGSIAYVFSAARHVPARLFGATVTIDGEAVWHGRSAMVLMGNFGTVSGGLTVFPDARPDDGCVDIAVLAARSVREWASVVTRLLLRRSQRDQLVHRFSGAEVEVTLDRAVAYELDGEDRPPTTALQASVDPRSLRVRC